MRATSTNPVLDALRAAVSFHAIGKPAGNLTIGRGSLEGRAVHVALVENRAASGSVGTLEAKRLSALLTIVARERSPLVLYLDSAGAKVSEGLKALGAFRSLFRAALGAAFAGAPLAIVLGRNCFGGASMLAHLAPHRLYSPATQLAMSGPSILAAASGANALDEMFRAIAEATIGAGARAKASAANSVWSESQDVSAWLRQSLAARRDVVSGMRGLHAELGARLPKGKAPTWEAVQRKDLGKLYPEGYEVREADGLLLGQGVREGAKESVLGVMTKSLVGADRAWRFADSAWQLASSPPAKLQVLLDCESHAPRLEDEKIVLSEYLVGMSLALHVLAAAGTRVELTILGRAGGGVYVALAAPAHRVRAEYGAQVQVLPGAALAAILGEEKDSEPRAAEYVAAGVADEEIRLGLVA